MSYAAAKPPPEEPDALIGRVRVRGGAARRLAALPGSLMGQSWETPGGASSLIAFPKLFTSGEESLCKLRPQPMVNNFASRAMKAVNKLALGATGSPVTPGWEDEFLQPPVATARRRLSLPARRLGSKRILQMWMNNVSSIRTSLSPSQRARDTVT